MKYAIYVPADQTFAYLTDDRGTITTKHAEAKLWEDVNMAVSHGVASLGGGWLPLGATGTVSTARLHRGVCRPLHRGRAGRGGVPLPRGHMVSTTRPAITDQHAPKRRAWYQISYRGAVKLAIEAGFRFFYPADFDIEGDGSDIKTQLKGITVAWINAEGSRVERYVTRAEIDAQGAMSDALKARYFLEIACARATKIALCEALGITETEA